MYAVALWYFAHMPLHYTTCTQTHTHTHTHTSTHTHHTNTLLCCNSHKIGNRLLTCAWIPETCTHAQAHTHTQTHWQAHIHTWWGGGYQTHQIDTFPKILAIFSHRKVQFSWGGPSPLLPPLATPLIWCTMISARSYFQGGVVVVVMHCSSNACVLCMLSEC